MECARRSLSFDRVADDYDRTRGGMDRGEAVAAAVAPLLPADPVLEIGVGTGLVAAGLTRHGRVVVGVDLSLPMLRYARDRIPGRVVAGDALRLPFGDGSVGGVVMIHVLHVVADIGATLAEATRVLRPGGRLVASVWPRDTGPTNDLAEVVERMRRDARVADQDEHAADVVVNLAGNAGLAPAGQASYRDPDPGISPAEVADRLAARSWSWTWQLSDATWTAVVEPTIRELRRLPDPDRPRGEGRPMPLLVFDRAPGVAGYDVGTDLAEPTERPGAAGFDLDTDVGRTNEPPDLRRQSG